VARGTAEAVTRSPARADAAGPRKYCGACGAVAAARSFPVEELHDERLADAGVRLLLNRDDLINPDMPGNKWRKLKYNLAEARRLGHHTLLTFGGADPNQAAPARYRGTPVPVTVYGRRQQRMSLSLCTLLVVAPGERILRSGPVTWRSARSGPGRSPHRRAAKAGTSLSSRSLCSMAGHASCLRLAGGKRRRDGTGLSSVAAAVAWRRGIAW
jgi:hypothetical protein